MKLKSVVLQITQELQRGNLDQALLLTDRLETNASVNPAEDRHYLRAVIFGRQGKLEKARELLELHLENYPNHASGYHNLSVILWKAGLKNEAVKVAKHARELDPNDLEIHVNLVEMYSALQNQGDLLNAVLHLLAYFESYAPALEKAAEIYLNKEQYIKAKYYMDLLHIYHPGGAKYNKMSTRLPSTLSPENE